MNLPKKPLQLIELKNISSFLKEREEHGGDMSKIAVETAIRSEFGYTLNHVRRILEAIPECKLGDQNAN